MNYLTYKYDENDNIISIESSDGSLVTYKYDELEQLVRENDSKAGTTTIYTYDKGGNITSQKVYAYTEGEVSGTPTKTKSYEYKDSNWRDLLTSYNGQSITYDEIGNPIQYRDGYNFTWTNGRSLKNVKKGDISTSYKYNKDGIRTEKTVNGKKTKYQLEESNIVKETSDGQTIWYIYDGNGDLIGFELNGTSYYYDKNLQGDIIGIYDTKGAKVVTYRYDAWGNIISMDGDEELAKKNPFRYRGYYYDEEIGLYYLNSRYYDAEVGRFVNADDVNLIPTMQSGVKGTNLFEYCDNNVVNKADSTGHWGVPTVVDYAKKMGKKLFNWLLGRVKARIKKLACKIIKMGVKRLKTKINAIQYQLLKLNKKIINCVSKVIKTVAKNAKKYLKNVYKNFVDFFNNIPAWYSLLASKVIKALKIPVTPVTIGIAVCVIFILFNYEDAY